MSKLLSAGTPSTSLAWFMYGFSHFVRLGEMFCAALDGMGTFRWKTNDNNNNLCGC